MKLPIKILDNNLPPLKYVTEGAAAFDVRSCAVSFPLYPGEQKKVPLGFAMAIPEGYCALLLPRSGNADEFRLTFGNGVGLIDSDYTGEVMALLTNAAPPGTKVVTINKYDRIGQIVIVPRIRVEFEVVEALDPTKRGDGGFGHTGVM